MRIPDRIAHLRTDRRGLPVPYVNRWGPEQLDRLSLRFDPAVGGVAIFDDDDGETEPDFTRQSMHRQRRCVAEGLCQVCARPVPWSRRFLVVSSMSVDFVYVESLRRTVATVTEPWLDEFCADFAMTKCPALIRRKRDEELQLVPVTSKRDVVLIVSRGWVEGPLEEESRRVEPAMWCKIALRKARIERGEMASDALR